MAHSWSAALPGYTLAPEASLTQITDELRIAFDWLDAEAAGHGIAGPVIVTGWSAGGPAFQTTTMTPLCRPTISSRRSTACSPKPGPRSNTRWSSHLYEPDLQTFWAVDSVWPRFMPVPPGRASMGIKGLIVPGACFVASLTVLVPDNNHKKENRGRVSSITPGRAK